MKVYMKGEGLKPLNGEYEIDGDAMICIEGERGTIYLFQYDGKEYCFLEKQKSGHRTMEIDCFRIE